MRAITSEIASQPALWRKAAGVASAVAGLLPAPGEPAAAIGCGTSLHVARAYAALREERNLGMTDAATASELSPHRSYARVVAISRSGTTTEILRTLERLRGSIATVAVTAVPGSPVASAADDTIVLEFANEQSVVQTRFATTALALLRAHIGDRLEAAIVDGETALAEALPAEPTEFKQFVFLGQGWTVGLADEAALKLREAASAWTEAYPAMEYRHGPISAAGPGPSCGPSDRSIRACSPTRRTPEPPSSTGGQIRWPSSSSSRGWPSGSPRLTGSIPIIRST